MEEPVVLVVEDQRDTASLFELVLQHSGYRVLLAHSGEVALKLFDKHHPDAALLDLNLPTMSGQEVYEYIRSKSDIPVVIMTANVMFESANKYGKQWGDAFFAKPFDVMDVVTTLGELLKQRAARG